MTTEEENQECDPCVAGVLAVTLVSQVLDEASDIANAAKISGQPWRHVLSLIKLRSSRLNELYDDDVSFTTVSISGDTQYLNDNVENLSDTIATSTPQKPAVQAIKSRNETNIIIGQGDEEFEVSNTELRKSTSMIINHLFDMSDVEHVDICDETNEHVDICDETDKNVDICDKAIEHIDICDEAIEHKDICDETDVISINKSSDRKDLLVTSITKIMDSYVNNALNIALGQNGQGDDHRPNYCKSPNLSDKSSYSFLSDSADIPKKIFSLNLNDEVVCEKKDNEDLSVIETEIKKNYNENEVAFYEDAYLTLNRDYEQYSEDDEPVLQDPKAILMQEVELLTANTSSVNLEACQVQKEVESSGMSTSAAGSRKSSLVHRCRIQGARLLSCFRGWWWRRKLPGRRKVPRAPGSIRGLCPLSPDARRRAASLLDQRHLRTPSPSTSLVWKFNTVNEALIHSSRWKEYGLKMSLNENDEF